MQERVKWLCVKTKLVQNGSQFPQSATLAINCKCMTRNNNERESEASGIAYLHLGWSGRRAMVFVVVVRMVKEKRRDRKKVLGLKYSNQSS